MQFHLNGYESADPTVRPAAPQALARPNDLPETVDILIVGTGPAGMLLAAQLAQFPDISTRIIERRPGRLEIGQADGVQSRTVETFQAFGFAERIIAEAYRITEMAFWKPDPTHPERIARVAVTPDDPHGISEFPHLVVNQARVLDYFAEAAFGSPSRLKPDYGVEFLGLRREAGGDHPVHVRLRETAGAHVGRERMIRARYVVGADGARSRVRDAIGRTLVGDQAFHAWGVMDILANSDFPDIRTKCAIQSHDGGNILLIPREGGFLFRMYVDLGEVPPDDRGEIRKTPIEEIIRRAQAILHPYTLDVKSVAWQSVYEVGHRLADGFDDVLDEERGHKEPRVFILGDACHTHSAKAGQGMNVSMQDGFNLGWKLAQVLRGQSLPELLSSYSDERRVVARDLIEFDKQWSTLMARPANEYEDPSEIEKFYVDTAEFAAGFMTQYAPSRIIDHPRYQQLATGYPLGKRFTSSLVVRRGDGNPIQLGHVARADGRWRVYAFADASRPARSGTPLADWALWLTSAESSPLLAFTSSEQDIDSVFDVKVIYQQRHSEIEFADVPGVFLPCVGRFGLIDHEKVFGTGPGADPFEARGINRAGAIVLVRPDQYVSAIFPLDAKDEFAAFLEQIFASRGAHTQR